MKIPCSKDAPIGKAILGNATKILCLIAILALTSLLRAQSFYGTVVGTVADASGAVVPGAAVTVTNTGTSEAVKAQTGADGQYSVFNLVPANYSVTVEKAGFKRLVRDNVRVQVGATTRIDLSLAVGSTGDTVEVTSSAPLLQTDSSSLSQEVEGTQVQEMPLNGRNIMGLIALTPGVVPSGDANGGTGLDQSNNRSGGGLGWGNYQVGGAIQGGSAQYIDGVTNNLLGGNIVALVPTQDAVQEFSVISSNAGADFGRFEGGVVNITTKSGTNALHGTAYEYLRNRDFNANDWFSNHNGTPRVQWNQNQYGAALNGPIKRDKAFFMFTWEGIAQTIGSVTPTNVPTTAMQNGVFQTAINDPLGNCNIAPYTGQSVNGQTFAPGGYYITNLYSGACGDPLNRILKTYYPAPNSTLATSNWFLSTPTSNHQNQYNGRLDYNISDKQHFFGRYSYWSVKDSRNSEFQDKGFDGATWPTASVSQNIFTHQAVLGDSYALNPTTVLDLRTTYTRVTNPDIPEEVNADESQFDKYNTNKNYTALAPQMSIHTIPAFSLNGGDNLAGMNNAGNFSINWYNNYALSANLVKILGSHTIKVGGEARLMDASGTFFVGGSAGNYNYNNSATGDEFASFLLGYSSQIQFQSYEATGAYSYYQAYYVTDTWQATRKLTLNLGLRYELPGAIAERKNRMTVLLPDAVDPYTGIKGTLSLVDTPLYHPRTDAVEKYNLFAPRLGVAYRATKNTVIHGGYGLSFLPNDRAGLAGNGILPFGSLVNSNYTTVNLPQTGPPIQLQTPLGCIAGTVSLSNPTCVGLGITQSGILAPPGRHVPNFVTQYGSLTTYKGQTIAGPDPYQPYPYAQQWNLAVSHEFKGDWMAEASYSGLHGTNIPGLGYGFPGQFGLDELGKQFYSMGPDALSATATTCANAPGLAGQISVGQCLRPNPYYFDVQDEARSTGRQNYVSMQVTAEKRFKSAGLIMANYSLSRNKSDADAQAGNVESGSQGNALAYLQDFNNLAGEYSLISYDVTNRGVVSYVLNLPFGKGQRFGNQLNGVANTLASGWAINGITTFQSGFPIFLATANSNLLTNSFGGGVLRPNVVTGCKKTIGGSRDSRALAGTWFNPDCFVYPSSATDPTGQVTFGNEPRTDPTLRTDGIKNFDVSFQKSTTIHDSLNFEFRVELFNVFNRAEFSPPNNTQGGGNFGQVTYQVNTPRQMQVSGRINF